MSLSIFAFLFAVNLVATGMANIVIAARCNNGMIIASDNAPFSAGKARTTLKPTASAKTIIPLTNDIVIAILDGTSKVHSLFKDIQRFIREYRMDLLVGQEGESNSVDDLDIYSIAKYARRLVAIRYPHEHIAIAGYSRQQNSYCLYEIMKHGSLFSCDFVVGGSGGQLAQSHLEDIYRGEESRESSRSKLSADPLTFPRFIKYNPRSSFVVCTKSADLPVSIDDVLPNLQRLVRVSSSIDQRGARGKFDVWLLKDEEDEKEECKAVENPSPM